eukprot:CAMPEP_0182445708 /NCGR_PEP_ID=MMETSP1172-20130603/3738_1 /TAXON_ID=708627 /ORGANISM="Timspurckia oligopyrenoides, Strain CCMP3278" /LENGTH=460 /DNA_ID=CAMNT_0024641523 /DNA_START=234 /DNA_END=1616 /DNA_ORIENTATION=-
MSATVGSMEFEIPVVPQVKPPEETILSLLASLSLNPKGPGTAGHLEAKPMCVAFYLPETTTDDDLWAMGSVYGEQKHIFGLAFMIGLCPDDSFRVQSSLFVVSRATGDLFEIMYLVNGMVVVCFQTGVMAKISFFFYSPGVSVTRPGKRLRRFDITSLVDCTKCSQEPNPRICDCVTPSLPVLQSPMNSFADLNTMISANSLDRVVRKDMFDSSDRIINSSIGHRRILVSRTTRDSLPLFQTLVLGDVSAKYDLKLNQSKSNFLALLPESSEDFFDEFTDEIHEMNESDHLLTSSDLSSGFEVQDDDIYGYSLEFLSSCQMSDPNSFKTSGDFTCEICGRSFAQKFNMQRHVASVHDNNRQFPCDQCELVFKLRNHLIVHRRAVHLNQQEFPCDLCGKSFKSKSNVTRHKNDFHAKHKMFQCPFCPKMFAAKFNCERHMRVHGSDDPTTTITEKVAITNH